MRASSSGASTRCISAIGVFLDYYDVAYEGCNITGKLESELGFKRVLIVGKDVNVIDDSSYKGENARDSIFVSTGRSNILSVLGMSPRAIVFSDLRINKKVLEQMRERGICLCLPISAITCSYGLQRSRNIYMLGKLLDYAAGLRMKVSFVTLAKTGKQLCSFMQIVEIAKMLGASDSYARKSISETNSSLAIK